MWIFISLCFIIGHFSVKVHVHVATASLAHLWVPLISVALVLEQVTTICDLESLSYPNCISRQDYDLDHLIKLLTVRMVVFPPQGSLFS